MTVFRKNEWLNLSIDVWAFADHCFKNVLIRSVDFIKIMGSCKIMRVFTMIDPIYDDELDFNEDLSD